MPSRSRKRGRNPVSELTRPPGDIAELSRHLVRAQEEERKRISRELHDEAGQGLMVLRLHLGMLMAETAPAVQRKIEEAMGLLDQTIGDLRRIMSRLSPRVLEELGLIAAIRKEARELTKNTSIKAHLDLPEALEGIDHEIEIGIYRSVQEALNNIAKHSQAKQFWLRLGVEHGCVRVLVEDDGVGFSRNGSSASGRSFGIVGMRERVAALGGAVRIQSRRGRGTRVKVSLPAPGVIWRDKKQLSGADVHGLDNRTASVFSRSSKGDSLPHEWRSSA